MRVINRLKELTASFKEVWKRFPVTIIACIVIGIVISVIFVHEAFNLSQDARDTFTNILLSLSIFAVYSINAKILIESYNVKRTIRQLIWGLVSLAAVSYYIYIEAFSDLKTTSEGIRVAGILILGVVLFTSAILRKQQEGSEIFAQHRGWRFVVTCFFWGVIGGGISFVLFSIDQLLNITVEEEIYQDVFIFTGALFAPSFFLMDVPQAYEKIEKSKFIKLFKVLLQYVFMPLLWAYTAVMYIYFIRLLVTWEWPNGMVGNLVFWYALVGIATLYFSNSIRNDNKWIAFFHRWFPFALIMPLILLFISIGIRINQYGITENRYFVIIAGLWIFGSMLYLGLVSANKINIKRVTTALSVVIFISVIGPLGASPVSSLSQNMRLEKVLNANGLLDVNGKVMQPEIELPLETQKEIRAIIWYFQHRQDISKIRSISEELDDDNLYDFFKLSEDMYDANEYVWAYLPNESIIDVSGYNYVVTISARQAPANIETEKGNMSVSIENSMIEISLNGKEVYTKDLAIYYDDFYTLCKQVQSENRDLEIDEAVFLLEDNNKIKIKGILKSANLSRSDKEAAKFGSEYIIMFSFK